MYVLLKEAIDHGCLALKRVKRMWLAVSVGALVCVTFVLFGAIKEVNLLFHWVDSETER